MPDTRACFADSCVTETWSDSAETCAGSTDSITTRWPGTSRRSRSFSAVSTRGVSPAIVISVVPSAVATLPAWLSNSDDTACVSSATGLKRARTISISNPARGSCGVGLISPISYTPSNRARLTASAIRTTLSVSSVDTRTVVS